MDAQVLGENIKNMIKKSGFTQNQIAEFIGVDQSLISKFEKGDRSLNFELVDQICTLCGFSLSEVLKGNLDKKPLTFAFRSTGLSTGDMKAISEINQIAFNLIRMQELME